MYWKYSLGFLIASLAQAGIIAATEAMNISNLGATLTFGQLVMHILAGQAAGFLLMVILQSIASLGKANVWLIGIIYGAIVWAVLIPINSAQGTINAPWAQGTSTLLSSMLAFIVYGIISTYTIKSYGKTLVES